MAIEHPQSEPAHELRLEGAKLLVGIIALSGFVLAAVVGAFLLGRWVESRAHPGQVASAEVSDPLGRVVGMQADAAAEDDLTYFDHLEGEQKALEPGREVQPPAEDPVRAAAGAAPAKPAPETPAGSGAYYVQVFAGRDRRAAEGLVGDLQGAGYRVRLFTEREGTGSLFKVQVGGYRGDEEARAAAKELQKRGFSGAWVTRPD